ncbi:hypothetical protein [Saccharomonospora viridis]|uniref:hypothetical protein n=1 Tax=Saccharomonospora viridis TaxID=1852 RepID=UPI0023F58F8F|nr:hypothetical protein [Saccharomonospora viridis]
MAITSNVDVMRVLASATGPTTHTTSPAQSSRVRELAEAVAWCRAQDEARAQRRSREQSGGDQQ